MKFSYSNLNGTRISVDAEGKLRPAVKLSDPSRAGCDDAGEHLLLGDGFDDQYRDDFLNSYYLMLRPFMKSATHEKYSDAAMRILGRSPRRSLTPATGGPRQNTAYSSQSGTAYKRCSQAQCST